MNKIKVMMIVSGFPTVENPSNSVFNKRAADQLSSHVDLSVLQLRTLKPGRKIFEKDSSGPYTHYKLSLPYISFPSKDPRGFNVYLSRMFGWNYMKKLLMDTDIIHSVGVSFPGLIASEWSKKTGNPHIVQLTGSDVNSDLPMLLDLNSVKTFKAEGIGCDSISLKDNFIKLLGEAKNMKVIYRGIDYRKYSVDHSSKEKDGLTFLFLGGLPNYKAFKDGRNTKGGITLMKAWHKFEEELNALNAKLIFAGPDSASKHSADWISALKYPGNVDIKGSLSHEEVKKTQLSSDVVLMPSMQEGLPNVLLEAGASGKCVIASRTGGIPEVIEHMVSGVLVEPGNEGELGKWLIKITKDKNIKEELGKNLRCVVERRFDSHTFAPAYVSFYKELMKVS